MGKARSPQGEPRSGRGQRSEGGASPPSSKFPVRIIPCLDIKDGRVVKGVNFVNLVDAGDPVEQASLYDAQGADELCFLDITATSDNRGLLLDMVEKVAATCFMPFTVGGGVRTLADIRSLLLAGADKVSINSAAVARPEFVAQAAEKFGSQCIVVAIDAKQSDAGKWEIFTHGGRKETGIDAVAWAVRMEKLGAGELLITSMDRDGARAGYDIELLRSIAGKTTIPLIASGGIGSLDDFAQGARAGATGLLAASVFHFGEFTVSQVKDYLNAQSIPVRNVA